MNRLRHIWLLVLLLATEIASAETVVWSDNFETNSPKRWAAPSPWHIGPPSTGPATNAFGYRTFSGTNCASTQGFGDSQEVRLICTNYIDGATSLLIPTADQYPRLRFWQWSNFGNALGYVEISADNGATWSQISPTYLNVNGGGVWSRPYFDLSAFAGKSVQFAFHFVSGGCCVNALGWYIDDVAVVTGTPVLNFPEGFESGEGDWSVDFGTWEVGKPTSGPGSGHLSTNCAATVLAGNYANSVDSRLISPLFLVPSNAPSFRFWQWCSFNNALGYVEVNNGALATTIITNATITTNVSSTRLDTNIYQLSGPLNTDYTTPFYWNPKIGGWTNAVKALGSAFDYGLGTYFFEGGSAPLANIGGSFPFDYRANTNLPAPPSASPTNFIVWQGMTWNSRTNGLDNPVGYFATNYTYTYHTNTTITTNQSNWVQISPTNLNINTGGKWTNVSLDLSSFAGQTVIVAFHFTSGGVYSAPGWYVDDVSVATPPTFNVPTNQVISFGQTFTNNLSATNDTENNLIFTFGIAGTSTNVVVTTNGVVTWTNTAAPPGTYPVYVQVTDNNTPPFAVTNNFSVTVQPLPSQLVLTNTATITNSGGSFKFSVKTPWTNSTWIVFATTNLSDAPTNWLPIYTNHTGPGGALSFTDRLSTNFLRRYYRAVFP